MKYSTLLLLSILLQSRIAAYAEEIAPGVTFRPGAVNGVLIQRGDDRLVVYGDPTRSWKDVSSILLTHGRRDVVWAARPLIRAGAAAFAPSRESYWLEKPREFWQGFSQARFHDYAQQSTKIEAFPLPVARWVKDAEQFDWQGLSFSVIETPGYTRGSATYITTIADKKIAFTGDLIYGQGQILDLYSFQDAIPEAQVRGYHGYGGRLAQLVNSLQKLAEQDVDLIVPARGPLIRNPQTAIRKLTERVKAVYRNYLSTNALHWYFKESRMRTCGERVLGKGADIELMPYAQHEQTPAWVYENSTSRLLISDNGHGFLLDCGYQRVIDGIDDLISKGIVKKVDGIFVTHYHDDHTDMVQTAAEHFQCTVYATREYQDILERPHAYHMPAMTSNAIHNIQAVDSGHQMDWHEIQLTFHFFPGQAIYHGALHAKKKGERPILFVGDAFAPSGIDDYCVLNRNLIHEDSGFFLCLNKVKEFASNSWLVNEHIQYVFAFSDDELKYLENRYRQRKSTLATLFPWDDPNYGIDEQWAVYYPYGTEARPAETVEFEVRLTNHSPVARSFRVTPGTELPFSPTTSVSALAIESDAQSIRLQPRESGAVQVRVKLPQDARGHYLLTADVQSEGMEFRDWVEALIEVKDE